MASLRDLTIVVAQASQGCLSVSGPDRKTWLNGVVTCDVAAVGPERGVIGLLLNKQGKVQTDLVVLEGGEKLFLRVAEGRAASVCATLDKMLVMEDAELADASEALAFVFLHGPRALELARGVSGALALGTVTMTVVDDVGLVVPRAELTRIERELSAAGAFLDRDEAWTKLRIESGWPEFGRDYGEGDNAHEAGLDRRSVSWSKGCYLGQEVVCMQDMRGKVKRRVALIELAGAEVPPPGAEVSAGEAGGVGRVSSSVLAGEGSRALALAMLKAPYFEPESQVSVGGRPGRVLASPGALASLSSRA